ncbi:MAG: twin-arginine translocase TatA/TatE family subunit [Calditrichaeota bacterium]|nr:twin-arginine translocase TatA/TatE family subunit [Candidatus Cloacimonadota bacterium]MCA9785870.1 twin-arginine translocase TatA/TatE family subunit [Candidatus Cloacimonadota bacterium]MCB1047067.1 twin-arginine translocase TatA/TatE family subunit [Calditrichota bacterium]MCB9474791.1 twin-arginine translocase TatA/TatE family subunit [Candidatus Delongbacteria bacterium]
MSFPGGWEMLLILLGVLLLFGGKKIPEIAHGLGKAITEFKRGMRTPVEELKKEIQQDDPKDTKAP